MTGKSDIITKGDNLYSSIMQNDPDDQFCVENCKRRKGLVCQINGKKYFYEFIDLSINIITEHNHFGF